LKVLFHFSFGTYSNTYVVGDEDGGDAIIIDPGKIDTSLIDKIESNNYTISSVLLTHRHRAHTEGLHTLLKIYTPTIYAGSSSFYDYPVQEVTDTEILTLGNIEVEAIHLPGHTIDSFVYRIGSTLFTGDALHASKIGSTRGVTEKALLLKGIKEKLLTLDERFLVCPGHGTLSALKIEKLFNHDLIEAVASDDLAQLSHPSVLT
jgi:hydroxyacylglutathione hydrolase